MTRDDLPDGGAAHWAATVEAIRTQNPDAVIELLIPDLDARPDLLEVIVASKPDDVGLRRRQGARLQPRHISIFADNEVARRVSPHNRLHSGAHIARRNIHELRHDMPSGSQPYA